MANINISWTTIPADTSDIETYEVYVCDATANGHFTTAAQLQTKLDAIQGGATAGAQGLELVESITDLTALSTSSPKPLTTGSYHFGIAAKNQGGFKVLNDTSVTALAVA
ncbi:MAG TPA: hypothetical protein DCS80_08140 [Betaproteobacteria bacterium]|nr:hypothetical protein [Betaproteobacteria bacterium]